MTFFTAVGLLVTPVLISSSKPTDIGAAYTIEAFRKNALLFTQSLTELNEAVKTLSGDTASLARAKKCLLNCRLQYKRIAFFTAYFFPSETKLYNAPAVYEVEEPELELEEPMGLQQIEALLFDKNPLGCKKELLQQTDAIYTSAEDLPSLLYQFEATDRQVLESLRLELIRMATLYISGYDAPWLKSGIQETLQASNAMQETLQPYLKQDNQQGKLLSETLDKAIGYLSAHQDFDSFDRMAYLTRFNLPLQQQLGGFIKSLDLESNTTAHLNYATANLFSAGFLNYWDAIPAGQRKELIAVGKDLFFDRSLSGNLQVSCATCHIPEQYFADGKFRSASMVRDSVLKRNTPTLLYAGYQHMQFWDGRAPDLAAQVKDVLFSPIEMGSSHAWLQKNVWGNPRYRQILENFLQDGPPTPEQQTQVIATAIAAYVNSLSPMNSPFDRYVRGDKQAMTGTQIKGFNLFMGKAQCGTCHFPPYFNALLPPLFDISETEVLGTPLTDQLKTPTDDNDLGRYDLYQIRFYRQAFKTPTVRNAQKTAPYMHNGAFNTLETVLDFYNKGGGHGIGLETEAQTLSDQALNLTSPEMQQIIQFINALTDDPKSFSAN
ncbi:MAG TPA: cytochrome c peroxidase [Parafilimonas sp.]|nr:cytochrome c peroxidase [Parafilimonas sp.]